MELLHHFVTHTAKTLSDQTEHQHIWQTAVVQIAFKHKFLMHGILAVAGLHVSVTRQCEEDDLSMLAANHQDLGLQGFRSALENFNSENCEALFAFSILVACYIIASSGTRLNPNLTTGSVFNEVLLGAVVDWIRIFRGTDHIARRGKMWLEDGPLAPLLVDSAFCQITQPIDDKAVKEDEYLASLQQLWHPGTPSMVQDVSSEEAAIYDEALHYLREAYGRMSRAKAPPNNCTWCYAKSAQTDNPHQFISPIVAGYFWFVQVPVEFFEMLEQHKTVALVLLVHQGVLIKRVGNLWWNRTPAFKVASSVNSTIPSEYHAWLEWPNQEIEYDPHAD
ncbi:hypothetical protein AUEXF2481DRAFT_227272 [Aureobasidium subglaciale EXF-2481]|uniref:Uncharacterized protein n=1 Tax=Aureobasidium subglaciale (strain EXF-2481) TaxID=1043005 RepID=A0A074Z7Q6_AURSE|nr:uncharacterized protein AUEXF2481DRAFT_227272 [Aureobasidium subglaciale EXF-2481]KEQ94916.1 hypothetical protein AUEXF2481DRAFT_227272 [Aureobasidium subglaciale EXF-2481]